MKKKKRLSTKLFLGHFICYFTPIVDYTLNAVACLSKTRVRWFFSSLFRSKNGRRNEYRDFVPKRLSLYRVLNDGYRFLAIAVDSSDPIDVIISSSFDILSVISGGSSGKTTAVCNHSIVIYPKNCSKICLSNSFVQELLGKWVRSKFTSDYVGIIS